MRSQDRSTCYLCSIISNFVLLSWLIATQWSIPLMRTSAHSNGRGAHLSSVPTWDDFGRGQVVAERLVHRSGAYIGRTGSLQIKAPSSHE